MKNIFKIIALLFLANFSYGQHTISTNNNSDSIIFYENVSPDQNIKNKIKYTNKQLESFLDSIGKLSTTVLMDKATFRSDSVFKNQQQINKEIDSSGFEKLKQAIKFEKIDTNTLKSIFGNIKIDTTFLEGDSLLISYISFDKNKNTFNEFAICLGSPNLGWSCDLYFFKSHRILAKRTIYHRYGLELNHYKGKDGKTVIYYKENFVSGSGIWWFNYYFFKYYDNELIPVLNELQNGNMQYPWGFRVFWLESFIKKKNPLTIKMVYNIQFPDTTSPDGMRKIVDDSTIIVYNWDEKSKTFKENYDKSKINKAQITSYYVGDDDILFINAYYKTLKACLLDKKKQSATFNYLNELKNYYENNPQ